MAGVGHELAGPGFRWLPRRQGGGDVVEHPVEGQTEAGRPGAGRRRGRRSAPARATSPRSRAGSHIRRGGSDPVQRRQSPPDDQDADRDGYRQRTPAATTAKITATRTSVWSTPHAETNDQHRPWAPVGRCDQPVAAEVSQPSCTGTTLTRIAGQPRAAAEIRRAHPGRQDTRVDRRPELDDASDHADRLAGRIEKPGRDRLREGPGAVPRRRRGRQRTAVQLRRAMGGLAQLSIELTDQIPVQRHPVAPPMPMHTAVNNRICPSSSLPAASEGQPAGLRT